MQAKVGVEGAEWMKGFSLRKEEDGFRMAENMDP